jgi:NADH-quinone oxidoreductase subunit F
MKASSEERSGHFLLPSESYSSYSQYLSHVGSSAARKARSLPAAALVSLIRSSNLRGRGGAGFPTGKKWETVASHPCEIRYAVCNAAEGEPGTFKDRWLLRKNPYAVIEGLLIAAHAIRAKAAYIAIKSSFRIEIEILQRAIAEMSENIFLPLTIARGPEEYLFGEEKALLNVIEGEGPFPRPPEQPPYEWGLFAKPDCANPALVNNAETLAHVSTIVRHGSESFRRLGTDDTPGTLLFTLSGDVARPGIYEREAGIPLQDLLTKDGGGPLPGRHFKAVLSGVSGAAIKSDDFSTPCDFGSFKAIKSGGIGLGSAGFVVLDDTASIPRVAQTVARFLYVESCLQCSACKTGLRAASEAIDEMFSEKATSDDPEKAVLSARSAPQGNRCYLPVQGSVLIPSLFELFPREFEALIQNTDREKTRDWRIPKFIDFDESNRSFSYDLEQSLKQPDWTYALTPEK